MILHIYDAMLKDLLAFFNVKNISYNELSQFIHSDQIKTKNKLFNISFFILYSTHIEDTEYGLKAIENLPYVKDRSAIIIWIKETHNLLKQNQTNDLTFFNNTSTTFVHIISVAEDGDIHCDFDFYYSGSKYVKLAIKQIVKFLKTHQYPDSK